MDFTRFDELRKVEKKDFDGILEILKAQHFVSHNGKKFIEFVNVNKVIETDFNDKFEVITLKKELVHKFTLNFGFRLKESKEHTSFDLDFHVFVNSEGGVTKHLLFSLQERVKSVPQISDKEYYENFVSHFIKIKRELEEQL